MRELETLREYEQNGIKILVRIKRGGNISIVERDEDGMVLPKRFLFNERSLEYMNGWRNILSAMDHAIDQAAQLQKSWKEEDEKAKDEKLFASLVAVSDLNQRDTEHPEGGPHCMTGVNAKKSKRSRG